MDWRKRYHVLGCRNHLKNLGGSELQAMISNIKLTRTKLGKEEDSLDEDLLLPRYPGELNTSCSESASFETENNKIKQELKKEVLSDDEKSIKQEVYIENIEKRE
nr:unnamed protein product [Callosobruchus analis]